MLCSSAWSSRSFLSVRAGLCGQLALLAALAAAPARAGDPAPAAVASASAPAQPAITLPALLDRFAKMSGLSAKFREEKRMALLAAPLVNEGTIYFAPKARLARHTTAPAPSVALIDAGMLRFADAGGREEIALDRNPAVRLFVDSFVKIFAGDREALTRMYAMELTAEGERWSLTLRPKLSPMDKLVERLELRGEGTVIATMRLVEIGGDETITTFTEVDAQRRFSPKELETLFSLPALAGR